MKTVITIALCILSAGVYAANALFPGFRSTDRAAIEAAALKGPTPYHRILGKLRLVQIDDFKSVDTYAKQAALIDKLLADEKVKDPTLKFCIPLCTPKGEEIWTAEGWHAAHKAGHYKEMSYLVNSVPSMRNARAELGDSGLFDRYDMLLRKNFSKYSPGAVQTAVQFMKPLLPAVDPVYAKVELTRLREMAAVVAAKAPEKWSKTLAMLDGMLASLK